MANSTNDQDLVRQVIQNYIDGSQTGNVDLLKSVFHSKALMSGYLQGQLGIGSPDPFFDAVSNNPSPEASGASYTAEITHIEVAGKAASATLVEKDFLGMDFTDFFHLIQEEGQWKIISKTFMQQ